MWKRILLPVLAMTTLNAAADTIPAGMNQFAANAYGELATQSGNIIFSPSNISTALSMALAGARGQTAAQMTKVLHQSGDASYHAALAALAADLIKASNNSGDELAMANGLWVQKDLAIQSAFEQTIRDRYGAPLTPLDFKHDANGARVRINSWTSDHTRGKIPELFGPGSLDAQTRLVLTSAIYFNGKWDAPFRPEATAAGPFKVQGGNTAEARFMRQTHSFDYGETGSLQILEMQYADQRLAFDVLLPKAADGLAQLEKSLTAANLDTWLKTLREARVEVSLPKFRAESKFELNNVLSRMGMPDAFKASADFSGIDGRRDLLIAKVVHKAFVDVSEQGTEAAAATGLKMMPTAVRPLQNIVFHADHPFIFLIRDIKSGVILFAGRLVKP
jgi:serpin B